MFDEVFTGLYRLGRFSSASFLQIHPDISCHAKLLTGGLVPLCATLASDSIYNAFLGLEKRDALLHGHSYTAHAVGCHVANTSLNLMMDLDDSGKWETHKKDWSGSPDSTPANQENDVPVWSVWSKDFISSISRSKEVESVIALGSVLAISLHDEQAGKTLTMTCQHERLTVLRIYLIGSERATETHTGTIYKIQRSFPGSRECFLSDG